MNVHPIENSQLIRFPSLGIGIHVTRQMGKPVQVIVDAPSDVEIIGNEHGEGMNDADKAALSDWRHKVRNKLYIANLSVEILQRQLAEKCYTEAESTLAIALESYEQLDEVALERPLDPSRDDRMPLAQSA